MRSARVWYGALAFGLVALLGLIATPTALAQDEEASPAEPPAEPGEEQTLPKGAGFNYRSHGFADPFLSPNRSRRGVEEGGRPPGVRGMRVEEVFLKGIFDTREGPVAMFLGSDGEYYSLRGGDRLYDGFLIEIDRESGTVWFRQENPDPTALRPYRDVPKTLYPEQEVRP
jgi:hypothetical protein